MKGRTFKAISENAHFEWTNAREPAILARGIADGIQRPPSKELGEWRGCRGEHDQVLGDVHWQNVLAARDTCDGGLRQASRLHPV